MQDEYRRFNHLYSVSRDGKALRKGEPYTPRIKYNGYIWIGQESMHRAVAHTWIRPLKKGDHVHHINGNPADNRVENLEILTQEQHLKDRHADLIAKLSKSKMTDEGKQKLRAIRLGKKMPAETRRKIGDAIKRLGIKPPIIYGPHSKERLAKRADNPVHATPCIVNGIRYKSFKAASVATGLKAGTLRRRCYSENFPDFQIG